MAEYYLISQLPSLDGLGENSPAPISEERFMELCGQLLGKNAQSNLNQLTLTPPRNPGKSDSALIRAWNEGERDLRLALGKARADKMKKSFDTENRSFPPDLLRTAANAISTENPMEAERLLNRYRLSFLETLRPMDTFSTDFLYYYGLKLKLILRFERFNTELGEAAYRDIYGSILTGDRLEALE